MNVSSLVLFLISLVISIYSGGCSLRFDLYLLFLSSLLVVISGRTFIIHARSGRKLKPLSKLDKLAFPILSIFISLIVYNGVFLLMVTFDTCKESLGGWVLALFSISMLVLLFLSILLTCGIIIEYKDSVFGYMKTKKLKNFYSSKLGQGGRLSQEELKTYRNNTKLHLNHVTHEYWKPFLTSFTFKMDQKSLDSIHDFDKCTICEVRFRIDCIFAITTCCLRLYHRCCLERFCFSTMKCPGCYGSMIYCIIDGMTGDYSDRNLERIIGKQIRKNPVTVMP